MRDRTLLSALLFICLLPLALLAVAVTFVGDALAAIVGRAAKVRAGLRPAPTALTTRDNTRASIIIVNWNGRDLLARGLPPVIAAVEQARGEQSLARSRAWPAPSAIGHEIIVVDNGSSDGSAELVRAAFPAVKVIAMETNLGFSRGNNIGVQAARNDIVVLLNNDMVVDPGFLLPLLQPFADERVFAVSAQIFMGDASQPRVETGLTSGEMREGRLHVAHGEVDAQEKGVRPCLWAGGGSAAFDRRRFLALGGFHPLYAPFYVEDVDLSYRAWARGWTVLFAPQSKVYHRRRSSASRLGSQYVEQALAKNMRLFVWHNINDVAWTLQSILRLPSDLAAAVHAGDANARAALLWAARQLPMALAYRWAESVRRSAHDTNMGATRISRRRALRVPWATQGQTGYWGTRSVRLREMAMPQAALMETAVVHIRPTDREIFRIAGSRYYYKERFAPPPPLPADGRKKILVVCPYLPTPPAHGGAVRMLNLIKNLSLRNDVDVLSFIDSDTERAFAPQLTPYCRRLRLVLRQPPYGRYDPLHDRSWHIEEFATPEMRQAVLEMMGEEDYHILQIEYTQMAQYHPGARRCQTALDEVDITFRSFYRRKIQGRRPPAAQDVVDYLKIVRFEVESCQRFDHVLAMSATDAACLASYLPAQRHAIVEIANGVDTSYYTPAPAWPGGRELLFVGSYRHTPNQDGISFFLRQVLPLIQRELADVRLTIVGDGPWADMPEVAAQPVVTATGFVDDMRPHLARCAVSVVPILSGAGTRIKILESLAAGIPVVSTTVGCEGIEARAGEHVLIADTPADFAAAVVCVLRDPALAEKLRQNGRRLAEEKYDWRAIVGQLDGLLTTSLRSHGHA